MPPIVKAVPLVIAGMLDSFVEDNKLTEIEACYNGSKPLEADLAAALKAVEAKNIPDAIKQLMAFASAIPAELSTCKAIGGDLKAVAAWAAIFKDKSKLESTIEKNLLVHRKVITTDLEAAKADLTAGNYFKSG